MTRPFGAALANASPEAWRVLDSTRPHPNATGPAAVRFHAAWLRILLVDLGSLGLPAVTYEKAAVILGCSVALIPALIERLRLGDDERPVLTEEDFARISKAH